MKKGDKIEVRNLGTDPEKADAWARATVIKVQSDGTVKVLVDHPGHRLHKLPLVVDEEHLRETKAGE
jgi:hypothetical protein